jgi:signal transduction histidine kinase
MRRSAWIFFASILLPSLGLAWMAVRSVQDQQVVLEHQQVIISQNITDALAKSVQGQMDQIRGDFVKTTQQLLDAGTSPVALAQDFNRKIRDVWPMAEIGFAVNLDGQIYSPRPYDGPSARTFRDENDRFLSNRENVEVYSSKSFNLNQNVSTTQNVTTSYPVKSAMLAGNVGGGKLDSETQLRLDSLAGEKEKDLQGKMAESVDNLKQNQAPMARPVPADLDQAESQSASAAKLEGRGEISVATAPTAPAIAQSALVATNIAASSTPSTITIAAPAVEEVSRLSAPIPQAAGRAAPVMAAAAPKADAELEAVMPQSGAIAASQEDKITDSVAKSAPQGAAPTVVLAPTLPTVNAPAASASNEIESMPVPAQQVEQPSSSIGGVVALQKNINQFLKIPRKVIPQQMLANDTTSLSNTVPADSDFRRVIGTETSGALARFLEDKLRLIVWSHPASDSPIVFGAQLDQSKLIEALRASLQIPEMQAAFESDSLGERIAKAQFCVAILDDTGHPVTRSIDGFQGDWKHPFVATEIGEVLPHWEAALYLVDPGQISRAARTLRLTFGAIVLLLVAAIVAGGSLIAADVRRQVLLAQQKTDFVSNVSHELKTPLTSIRMFADLLAEKRVPDEERQATYLRIIAAEASRLTRLINNVLDFARLERGAKSTGEHRACDLVEAVRDVVETCGPHLEAAGIAFQSEVEAESLPIRGDRDALAQIILNLVSNAEKYGGNDILVRVRRQDTAGGALGCVDVLDRGAGIPAAEARTIFEPFHRLDDSLSSGIPGSGLGLTLARRMARAHGGDVTYSARAGGGSCFTLTVPLEEVS